MVIDPVSGVVVVRKSGLRLLLLPLGFAAAALGMAALGVPSYQPSDAAEFELHDVELLDESPCRCDTACTPSGGIE